MLISIYVYCLSICSYELPGAAEFHWNRLKQARDNYIRRLNGIYESGLDKMHVRHIIEYAY